MNAPKPDNEAERLEALREYHILDTPAEADFDELVDLAAKICGTPMCLVSLVDENRQWFKANLGIGVPETDRSSSICAHAILETGLFEVQDTQQDLRFTDNPLVTGNPNLRFYAGARLDSPAGLPVGTLCVLDTVPRQLTEDQKSALKIIARQVMTQIELRRKIAQLQLERRAKDRLHAASQQASAFVRLVTDRLPVRVCYVDREYKYRFLNNAYSDEIGLSTQQTVGMTISAALGEAAFKIVKASFDRAFGGELFTQELIVPYRRGDRLVRATFVPDFDPRNEVRGVVVHTVDITQQREIEIAVNRGREELDRTLSRARVATFDWDIPNDTVDGKGLLDEFFGIKTTENSVRSVKSYLQAIHPDDIWEVETAMGQSVATGNPYETQYRVTGLEGRERWVLARGDAIRGPSGAVERLTGVVLDITTRMSAARALQQSEEQMRQLIELSPATVWTANAEGHLTYISQDYYENTGLTPAEALPDGWLSTVHPEDVPSVIEKWTSALADESYYDTEFRIRRKDGAYRWISARALPVYDAERRLSSWIGNNSDIQERKSLEEDLQARVKERTEDLQNAVREAEAFNYSISHDLRAPLRSMSATSRILLEEAADKLTQEQREMLHRQAHNAARLGTLIDELLRLSRLARVEVRRQKFDMTSKAKAVVEELQVESQVVVQASMTAEADPDLIRTVLQNLIGNACKFSPQKTPVHVGQTGNTYWVQDEGVGFEMKYVSKIFLPFERLVTENEFPGTGIGLANVERIVRRHDGKVWVESEPGKGSKFIFTLGS